MLFFFSVSRSSSRPPDQISELQGFFHMGIYGAWCPQAQDDAQIGNEMGDSIHVRKPKMDQHHGRSPRTDTWTL